VRHARPPPTHIWRAGPVASAHDETTWRLRVRPTTRLGSCFALLSQQKRTRGTTDRVGFSTRPLARVESSSSPCASCRRILRARRRRRSRTHDDMPVDFSLFIRAEPSSLSRPLRPGEKEGGGKAKHGASAASSLPEKRSRATDGSAQRRDPRHPSGSFQRATQCRALRALCFFSAHALMRDALLFNSALLAISLPLPRLTNHSKSVWKL
jgi:hypothetical protein